MLMFARDPAETLASAVGAETRSKSGRAMGVQVKQGGAVVARRTHNPKVASSILAPAMSQHETTRRREPGQGLSRRLDSHMRNRTMFKRSWQRALEDDPGSDIAQRVASERRQREIEAASRKFLVEHGAEIQAQRDLTAATRAQGLTPCTCGLPASCWIRCRQLLFSAACCPQHADNVIATIRGVTPPLSERDWDVSPLNIEYHMARTAGELVR